MPEDQKEQKLEPENWGDPEKKGLMGRLEELDTVFEKGEKPLVQTEESKSEPANVEPEKTVEANPEITKENTTEKEPEPTAEKTEISEKPAEESDDIPVIESDFFTEEEETPEESKNESNFDPDSYDAQTQKMVKAMEEKGHPGDAFAEVRAELKKAKEALLKQQPSEDIQSELKELRSKAEQYEGLKQRLDEVSAESAQLKVQNSPEYEREVLAPVSKILERAEQIAEVYEVESAVLKDIVRNPDIKQRDQMLKEYAETLGPVGSGEIGRLASEFSSYRDKREQMLENAEAELERLQVQELKANELALKAHNEQVQALQKNMWESNKELIPGFVQENGEVTETYTKMMSKGLSIDFSKARAKDQAFAAFAGTVLPHMAKELAILKKELAEYKQSEETTKRSSPTPSSSVKQTQSSSDSKKPKTFLEAAAEIEFS
jgi:hypothetical protein